ncbi:hypothetical protein [Vibrio metschnikovii]
MSHIKTITFILLSLSSILVLIIKKSKLKIINVVIIFLQVFILIWYFFLTFVFLREDGGALHQFISMLSMIIVIHLGLILYNSGLLSSDLYIKSLILGLFFYCVLKFSITVLIYFNYVSIDVVNVFSPDMVSLGYIGAPGFNRFVSVNDFFIPFVFFFVKQVRFCRVLEFLIKVVFLTAILFSFTRSIWVVFLILSVFSNIRSIRFILVNIFMLFLLILSLFYIESYSDFSIVTSIEQRLFSEGGESNNEKYNQSIVLLDELNSHLLFGKGLGTYVESYVRNDRLKYGYEVSWLVYAFQFGIPILIFWVIMLFSPFTILFRVNSKSIDAFFPAFCLFIFLLIGFTNPILLGNLTALFYLFLYLCNKRLVFNGK